MRRAPTIPADLTAARLRRANPSLSQETAQHLVAELYSVIADAQARWAARPGFSAARVDDLALAMIGGIIDDPPPPGDAAAHAAACSASEFLAIMLTDRGDGSLYRRYMSVFDRINGTDWVGELDDKTPSSTPPSTPPSPASKANKAAFNAAFNALMRKDAIKLVKPAVAFDDTDFDAAFAALMAKPPHR